MKALKATASKILPPKEMAVQQIPTEARLDAVEKRLSILERKGKN